MSKVDIFRQELSRKVCSKCGKPIPQSRTNGLCAQCEDLELFQKVKVYVNENNVTEEEVAEHFNIPLRKVHQWIHQYDLGYNK